MIYGYARVSTTDQKLDAQRATLLAAGAEKIFAEQESGAKDDRRQLTTLLRRIEDGDILIVTRLDRLARSTPHLFNIVAELKTKNALLKSLAEPWADYTTPVGQMMITVLAGVAEFERSLILSRTREGRVRAKARGQSLGRKFKLSPFQQQEAKARLANGEFQKDVAATYGVHPSSMSRLAKR